MNEKLSDLIEKYNRELLQYGRAANQLRPQPEKAEPANSAPQAKEAPVPAAAPKKDAAATPAEKRNSLAGSPAQAQPAQGAPPPAAPSAERQAPMNSAPASAFPFYEMHPPGVPAQAQPVQEAPPPVAPSTERQAPMNSVPASAFPFYEMHPPGVPAQAQPVQEAPPPAAPSAESRNPLTGVPAPVGPAFPEDAPQNTRAPGPFLVGTPTPPTGPQFPAEDPAGSRAGAPYLAGTPAPGAQNFPEDAPGVGRAAAPRLMGTPPPLAGPNYPEDAPGAQNNSEYLAQTPPPPPGPQFPEDTASGEEEQPLYPLEEARAAQASVSPSFEDSTSRSDYRWEDFNPASPLVNVSDDPLAPPCPAEYPDFGTLTVETYTARQAVPVEGSQITVTFTCGGREVLHYFMETGPDGYTPAVTLPAPDRELSQEPGNPSPYASYNVQIDHPLYDSILLRNVQVFGGIESLVPVEMVPLPESAFPDLPAEEFNLDPHGLNGGAEER